jgi:hypothetical protein
MGFGWSNAVYAEGSRDLTGLDVNPLLAMVVIALLGFS